MITKSESLGKQARCILATVVVGATLAVLASSSNDSCFTHSTSEECKAGYASPLPAEAHNYGGVNTSCEQGYTCTDSGYETLYRNRSLVAVGASGTTGEVATKCRVVRLCEAPGMPTKTCYSLGQNWNDGVTRYRALNSCTGSSNPEA